MCRWFNGQLLQHMRDISFMIAFSPLFAAWWRWEGIICSEPHFSIKYWLRTISRWEGENVFFFSFMSWVRTPDPLKIEMNNEKKKRIFTFNPTYLIILSYLRMAHDIIHHKVPGIRWNFSFSMEQRENIHLYSIKNMFKGWSYLYLHTFLNTLFYTFSCFSDFT